PESESTNLFILGGTSSTMNLYLQGPQGIEESGNVHLSIYSSQESGLFNTLNLSISGENERNSYLNLTIVGEGPYDSSTSYLYTFLKGIGNDDGSLPADLSCDFVLWNEFNQESNDLSLFLATASGTDGAIPVNG